ncbi:MAG: tetratricopeptide repeat protein [Armatimonadota bacterium]
MTDVKETETAAPTRSGEAGEGKPSFRLPPFLDNPAAAACIVALLTLAVFGQVLGFSFTNYDDITNVTSNPHFNPVTPRSIGYLWTHGYNELYMPVTYAICAFLGPLTKPIYVPGGGNVFMEPALFHGVSLLLHTANALLVFALLYRLVRRIWPACAGALLFALHPVQVESVAWVTGMNNLTSGFFGLLALWFYVVAADKGDKKTGRARLAYVLATVFYVLALLSKPTATAVPLIAAAIDWLFLRRSPSQWLRALIPWVVLAIGLAVITRFTSETSQKINLALWVRPFIAGDALAFYLAKLVFPIKLGVNYGRSMALVQSNWWGYVTWVVPAAVAFLLWHKGKQERLLLAGAAVFVAALVPMLGFVPYYTMEITTVSGRFLYLALLGAGMVLAWLLTNLRLPSLVRGGLCAALLLFFTTLTLRQLPYWRDTFNLATAQISINPNDAASQTNYGIVLASTGRLADAIPYFRKAIEIKPENAIYQYHLGTALEDSGDAVGAAPVLREAVRLDPRFTLAQVRLGGVLLKTGQAEAAIEPLQKAVEVSPRDASANYLLGIALAGAQRLPEAETQFRHVLTVSSEMPEARQALGRVLEKQGRHREAAQVYSEILKKSPENAEAKKGLERAQSAVK